MTMRLSVLLVLLVGSFLMLACQTPTKESNATDIIQTPESAWESYQARSDHWHKVDRDLLQAEVAAIGLSEARLPHKTNRFGFDPNQPTAWYRTNEGRWVADIVLSFQTPSGGWSKRTDMGRKPRQPGQAFGVEANYIPTFDNSATTTQIRVLARAYEATEDPRYRDAYLRGIELLLEAQYPNGGWPQSFPLRGGYHDYITFNDDTMANIMAVLHQVSLAQSPFNQIPGGLQKRAASSLNQALEVVVASQVVVDGSTTLWGGQHDPQTLAPRKARAYEMVGLATAESASLLDVLMDLELPPPGIQHAIHSAMAWYQANQINGYHWNTETRNIEPNPEAPPLWSRFVEIGTNRPLFGDRDHSVHYSVEDISMERREGYAWYITAPNKVLKKYQYWKQRFPNSPLVNQANKSATAWQN